MKLDAVKSLTSPPPIQPRQNMKAVIPSTIPAAASAHPTSARRPISSHLIAPITSKAAGRALGILRRAKSCWKAAAKTSPARIERTAKPRFNGSILGPHRPPPVPSRKPGSAYRTLSIHPQHFRLIVGAAQRDHILGG